MALDKPATDMLPSIETLANEAIRLEQSEPLGAAFEVSLGDSFAKLPPPQAQSFARQAETRTVHTYRLRDVVLDGPTMALFSGRMAIPQTLYMVSQGECEDAAARPLPPTWTDPERHYVLGVNRAFRNYYHWMVQSLPAIDWGVRNRRHPNVALALPPLQPWQEATLALLGHAGVARLALDSKSAFAVGPRARYALASAEYSEFLGERMPTIVSRAAAATFARLRQAVAPEPGSGAIYVARTDAQSRVAVNEAELIAMLTQQGVRIVVPGTLTVAQQIAIFRGAELVIGAHGAGLSNIVGCEPGSHLYELVPRHYPNVCFNRLAQSCSLNYWGDVFPSEPSSSGPHQRKWHIDLDVVAARLEEIRGRIAETRRAGVPGQNVGREAAMLSKPSRAPVATEHRSGVLRRVVNSLGLFRR